MTEALCAEIKTLQLIEPFRIAHGTSASRQVLRLRWGSAVGEAPFVTYYGENPEETLRWLQAQVWHGSPAPRHGPRGGLLALDLLWHDAIGKQRGVPLGKLLGLDAAQAPLGCRSFSIPDELAAFGDKVRETSRQFRVLKLKLGSGNIDFDEAIVARAYEMTLPSAKIMVDVNGGWRVAEAATIIPRLARYGLALIEQPIHHEGGVEAWRELRAALPCAVPPLFADESAQGADDVFKLQGLADGVNVKLLKCGSIAAATRMMRIARTLRLGILLGCMIESSVGVTAAAHLAPLADWIDLDGHLYVANDDYVGLTFDEGGALVMPSGAGLGVSLGAGYSGAT